MFNRLPLAAGEAAQNKSPVHARAFAAAAPPGTAAVALADSGGGSGGDGARGPGASGVALGPLLGDGLATCAAALYAGGPHCARLRCARPALQQSRPTLGYHAWGPPPRVLPSRDRSRVFLPSARAAPLHQKDVMSARRRLSPLAQTVYTILIQRALGPAGAGDTALLFGHLGALTAAGLLPALALLQLAGAIDVRAVAPASLGLAAFNGAAESEPGAHARARAPAPASHAKSSPHAKSTCTNM